MTEKVTPKKRKAVEALLTKADIKKAAEAAGVSRKTLYRWLKDADFLAALAEAEAEALATLSRTLVALGDQAVAVLRDAMRDSTAPINARLRAADMVLSRLLQLRELVNLDRRLSNLEARVNEEAL